MCCSRRMLGPPTQAGQPPAPRTHRTHCSSLPYPVLSPQACTPAQPEEDGKQAPGGSSIMLINALSSTKFHPEFTYTPKQNNPALCILVFSVYIPPTNVREISARVMGALEAVRTSGQLCTACTRLCMPGRTGPPGAGRASTFTVAQSALLLGLHVHESPFSGFLSSLPLWAVFPPS